MFGRRHPKHFDSIHVDMTPMVDCIMVLLIFLMVSSAFINDPGVTVQKPDVGGLAQGDTNALLIAITADDRIYFDGQEISSSQVAPTLRQAAIGRSPVLIIRADQASSHGVFAQVYAEGRKAGLTHIQFAAGRVAH